MTRKTKIAFDVGGVLSKYPAIFRPLVAALQASADVEVWILTDMSNPQKVRETLALNGFDFPLERIVCADYETYGEACKSVLLEQLEIDVFVDDMPFYLAQGAPVRLQLLPDLTRPYYHDSWQIPGETGDFGRRKAHHSGD